MQVTVEPEALAEWSAHARRTGTSLHSRLAALDVDLAPLAHTWHGAAADRFAARHRQWQDAAAGLLGTLDRARRPRRRRPRQLPGRHVGQHRDLAAQVSSTAVVVHAMAAGDGRGRGRGRIEADLEDIRTAVRALVVATEDLAAAWSALHTGLAGSAGMAGGADGAAFAADYDAMAAAAWQGWRRSVQMLDGIAGGLAATGNNLAAAEADSTTGPKRPFTEITASTAPVPAPALPPTAGGDGGGPVAEYAYWPTADPGRLRTAAATWRWSAAGLRDTVHRVFGAVDGLVQAGPDLALREMRRFTRAALSDDPTSGLTGVLAGTGGRIASACEGLADLTERTRARIVDTVTRYAAQEEWYHPVADVVDLFVRFRAGTAIAAAGDVYLMNLDLATIHDDHVRAVGYLRGELDPAGADRLARIATAMAPPTARPGGHLRPGVACRSDGRAGSPRRSGRRSSPRSPPPVAAGSTRPRSCTSRAPTTDGRSGSRGATAARACSTCSGRSGRWRSSTSGSLPAEIPGLALRALAEGPPIGRPKPKNVREDAALRRRGREPAFVYRVGVGGGRTIDMVVVKAPNGFIVTAYPFSKKVEPL